MNLIFIESFVLPNDKTVFKLVLQLLILYYTKLKQS